MPHTVLITGASRGIGKAMAVEFACRNYKVVGTATTQAGVDHIIDYLLPYNGSAVIMDVCNPESIENALKAVGPVNILINNAAITQDNLLVRMKDKEWIKVIDTNLTGTYYVTQRCIAHMIKARWGRIINTTSIVGSSGNKGQVNYSAAKAGLIGFTKSLAQEVASRAITVNAIAPGFIDTDMTKKIPKEYAEKLLANIPLKRLGEPKEVAYLAAFLASEEAAYITGQTIHINGGLYM